MDISIGSSLFILCFRRFTTVLVQDRHVDTSIRSRSNLWRGSTFTDCVFSFFFFQFHNTRSQRGEKEKEKDKQPDAHLDSDEEPADADLSLMNRTKRLAKEKAAKAADLRRQLAELEDQDDSPVESDVDVDQDPPKDMGAFVAAAVSFLFWNIRTFFIGLYLFAKGFFPVQDQHVTMSIRSIRIHLFIYLFSCF